jgi:hypothetical protein
MIEVKLRGTMISHTLIESTYQNKLYIYMLEKMLSINEFFCHMRLKVISSQSNIVKQNLRVQMSNPLSCS